MLVSVPGLFGGHAGARARAYVLEGDLVREGSPEASLVELRSPAQRATIEIAGGSGYGDPRERPVEWVQADLDAGYITPAGAEAYGVAVGEDGRVRRRGFGGGPEERSGAGGN